MTNSLKESIKHNYKLLISTFLYFVLMSIAVFSGGCHIGFPGTFLDSVKHPRLVVYLDNNNTLESVRYCILLHTCVALNACCLLFFVAIVKRQGKVCSLANVLFDLPLPLGCKIYKTKANYNP